MSRYLADPLWQDDSNYDAGHFVMVPLHAAFEKRNVAWQRDLADHFARFNTSWFEGSIADTGPILGRLQYLYLASRFAVLAHRAGQANRIPRGHLDRIAAALDTIWARYPVSRVNPPPGMRNSVRAFLDHPSNRVSDIPRFVFAIAADLRAVELLSQRKLSRSSLLDEILTAARAIFEQRVSTQPGVQSTLCGRASCPIERPR